MAKLGTRGQWLAAKVIRMVVHVIGATCRVRFVKGADGVDGAARLAELRKSRAPVVFSFWHNRAMFCAYLLYQKLLRHGFPITILVSLSRDGELGARLARSWKAGVVRGSASRGGTAGLRRLYRVVSREKSSAITIPDGPRGPLYTAKPGAVVLAQMCGVPIQPMAFAAEKFWTVRSWDRLIVPRPFTRIWLNLGAPLDVPKDLPGDALEGQRQRLEDTLNRLVEEARSAAAGARG